jgi:hypothetical protein
MVSALSGRDQAVEVAPPSRATRLLAMASARPSMMRRLAAIASIVLVVASLAIGPDEPLRVLLGLELIVVFLAAAWIAATQPGRPEWWR